MVFPAIAAARGGPLGGVAAWTVFQKMVAGEEGLEPSHAGIKIQCLYQLGDSPTLDSCKIARSFN